MFYELRRYITVPGKLPAINDRFAKHTIGFFKKHDIGILGFWTDEIGMSNQLTYILVFDSMADREKKWTAFQADSGWHQVRAETEAQGTNRRPRAQHLHAAHAIFPETTAGLSYPGIARV